ncbi:hypothetical protein EDC04DRAFT_1352345 [Pisolithus marmoratus]|nr:hypothetical protein EDC04DRAFT_2044669 [Pisolithus marmoratus]KAI6041055.1 hypothetical protein EDC04DRAFT_1352345 [Pisolithus marmoratus]
MDIHAIPWASCFSCLFFLLLSSRPLRLEDRLAKRASNKGHVVDLFANCLDQAGLLEMKSLLLEQRHCFIGFVCDLYLLAVFPSYFQQG